MEKTWRNLLGAIIAHPEEKARITEEMGLARHRQLDEWVMGTIKPQRENIKKLVQALPSEYRREFLDLLSNEYPEGSAGMLPLFRHFHPEITLEFIERIFCTLSDTDPALFPEVLQDHVLLRMGQHLDPDRLGLALIVALAKEDNGEGTYLQLDPSATFGTSLWRDRCLLTSYKIWGDSPLVAAVQNRKPVVLEKQHIRSKDIAWLYAHEQVQMLGAFPLLRRQKVAGCLFVASTQPSLPPSNISLQYTCLLALAFDDKQFHDPRFKASSIAQRNIQAIIQLDEALATLVLSKQDDIVELLQRRLETYQERKNCDKKEW